MNHEDVIASALGCRERCSITMDDGERCSTPATIVCKFYTTAGLSYAAACKTHMMRISAVIDQLIRREILPDE